ncbi:MAG: glycosyltransferase [Paludibacteraceae bacterium]
MAREEVATLMNAVDVCLMTSFTEGSPQFIKEAMCCNCPIVSVEVGDVKDVIGETEGCYVCKTYTVEEIVKKLKQAIQFNKKTDGRDRIEELDLDIKSVTNKVIHIYQSILEKK